MDKSLLPSYEIWNWIKGYEGRYEISNRGRVRSWTKSTGNKLRDGTIVSKPKFRVEPIIKKNHENKHGYTHFGLGHHLINFRVHREVAKMFVPNPHNLPEANHINGVKKCNEWWNFRWDTRVDNIGHAFETGLIKPALGEQQSNTKLTNEAVLLIYRHDAKTKKIAEGFGISTHAVLDIKRGRTWWHITGHPRHIKPSEKGKYKKRNYG